MAAHGTQKGDRSPVLHREGDRQGGLLQLIADPEGKGEGIAGPGPGGIGEEQGAALCRYSLHGQLGLPDKAVEVHGIADAVQQIASLKQPSHKGEEVGGAAAPVGGIPLPEVLCSPVPQGL